MDVGVEMDVEMDHCLVDEEKRRRRRSVFVMIDLDHECHVT